MFEPPRGRQWDGRFRPLVLAGLGLAAVALVLFLPPLSQDPKYHDFADQRTALGVPHFLNVVSNLPFLIIGSLGLWIVLRSQTSGQDAVFQDPLERWPWALFFLGIGLTAFGSSYYHLAPDNDRLVWDRLPMAVAFMALFSAIVAERIGVHLGVFLLPLLVGAGLASVLYWHWTEQNGRGDLRFYYLVQFYSLLILPLLLMLYPSRYTGTFYLIGALGWYVLAKLLELPLDAPIYALGHWVSGHTLKHLAAALAACWVLQMLRRRRAIGSDLP
jgi:hypothetical protein